MDVDSNGVKLEDVKIKDDPDAPSPVSEDEDDYEDTGELQFPKSFNQAWLIRVPKDLWTSLASMKRDDDDVELGEIKVWNMPNDTQKIRWHLNPPSRDSQAEPGSGFDLIHKDYDLQVINNPRPKNTFVFSEKDLPGYKPNTFGRGFGRSRAQEAARKTEGGRVDKAKYRGFKAIPKHTAYVAAPDHELHCTPRENIEWHQLQKRKEELARRTRKDLTVSDVGPPRMILGDRASDNFLRITEQKKPRPQDSKNARLDEDILIPILAEKFKQYKYWSLKALKEETRQPEAHLREQLTKIAYLVKTGPAANHWTLKSEMAEALKLNPDEFAAHDEDEGKAKEEEIAPELDDDDDEDDEMEDVV